ncbi:hypothetical protein D3C87_517930 [compost metagenome]
MLDLDDTVKLWVLFREAILINKLTSNSTQLKNMQFFELCVKAGYMRSLTYTEALPIYSGFLLRMCREQLITNDSFSTAYVNSKSVVEDKFVTWPMTSDFWSPTTHGMELILTDKNNDCFRYYMELRNDAVLKAVQMFNPGANLKFNKLPVPAIPE